MMPEIVTHADDLCAPPFPTPAPPFPTPVCECVNTKKRNATTDKNNVCTGRLTFPSATDCPEAVVEYRRRYREHRETHEIGASSGSIEYNAPARNPHEHASRVKSRTSFVRYRLRA